MTDNMGKSKREIEEVSRQFAQACSELSKACGDLLRELRAVCAVIKEINPKVWRRYRFICYLNRIGLHSLSDKLKKILLSQPDRT